MHDRRWEPDAGLKPRCKYEDARAHRNTHWIQNTSLKVTEKHTCSEPRLLLSLSQMAVGAEVGSWRRVRRFGPTFPLDEVGDPALSQGGGLRHMVLHRLRDTWTQRGGGQRSCNSKSFKTQKRQKVVTI